MLPADADERYMRMAIEASLMGEGTTSPNPMVGCVIVRDGAVVGVGWHARAGGDHAEVAALKAAGAAARGATAYVTLEPCNHHGRTPPCTEALVAAGVSRVVVALVDPDERVSGSGIERLRQAGVEVEVGTLARVAARANRRYLVHRLAGRPYVTLKFATSLDGRIADEHGRSRWITSEEARADAQELRRVHDAILVGSGTVLADDPLLTYRAGGERARPLERFVLTTREELPATLRVFGGEAPTVIFAPAPVRAPAPTTVVPARHGEVELGAVLAAAASRGVVSVLVEGGPRVHAAFVREGLFDEVVWYAAPRLIGGPNGAAATAYALDGAPEFEPASVEWVGRDAKLTFFRQGLMEEVVSRCSPASSKR